MFQHFTARQTIKGAQIKNCMAGLLEADVYEVELGRGLLGIIKCCPVGQKSMLVYSGEDIEQLKKEKKPDC